MKIINNIIGITISVKYSENFKMQMFRSASTP